MEELVGTDYCLVSLNLFRLMKDFYVDDLSDHLPISLTLKAITQNVYILGLYFSLF